MKRGLAKEGAGHLLPCHLPLVFTPTYAHVRYEMSVPLFLLGEVLLLWYIPFVFAPNRAVYSRLTEGSTNQV